MTDYESLCAQVEALTENVPYPIANYANTAACIWHALPDLNWAGFYLVQEDSLILGPFQGKPACIRIPFGKGVCGTAAQTGQTQRVADVHAFPGHIACDCASRSEIVVPLFSDGKLIAVMDLDSPRPDRFTPEDQTGLEKLARVLEKWITY